MHEATPGECTLCDRSCRYFIQNDFFCRLAGPVAPTGKAIVHWIGCINAIKVLDSVDIGDFENFLNFGEISFGDGLNVEE